MFQEFIDWLFNIPTSVWGLLLIPALVSYITGDTFVNNANKKRLHSEKLNHSIIALKDELETFYPMETRVNNRYKIIGIQVSKINEINYIEHLREHIKNGYPDECKIWDDYDILWKKRNKTLGNFKEYIQDYFLRISAEWDIKPQYKFVGREKPESYIMPENLADSIIDELEHRRKEGWMPFYYKPNVDFNPNWNQMFFFDRQLFFIKTGTIAKKVYAEFNRFFDEESYTKLYHAFLDAEHKLELKEADFKIALRVVSDRISLGHNINGICDTCVTILPLWVSKQYHFQVKPRFRRNKY